MYFAVYTHNLAISISSFFLFFARQPIVAKTPTPRQQQISTGTSILITQASTLTPTTTPTMRPIEGAKSSFVENGNNVKSNTISYFEVLQRLARGWL